MKRTLIITTALLSGLALTAPANATGWKKPKPPTTTTGGTTTGGTTTGGTSVPEPGMLGMLGLGLIGLGYARHRRRRGA